MSEPAAPSSSVQQPAWNPPSAGWALLFRSPKLAMSAQRLGLSLFAVVFIMGLGTLFDAARGPVEGLGRGVFETLIASLVRAAGELSLGVMTVDPPRAIGGVIEGVALAPAALFRIDPWSSGAMVLIMLPVWAFFGGAVSRSVVVEVARGRVITSAEAMAYAWSRRGSLVGAYLAPAFAALLVVGALMLFGIVLLWLPGLEIVGGVLYGIAIAGGVVLALIAWGSAVGFPLLIPAVAADASDAIDAVQRAYSYLFDIPGRLLLWTLGLLLQGAAAVFVLVLILVTALNWSADLTKPGGETPYGGGVEMFRPLPEHGERTGAEAVAASAVSVWEKATLALAGAFGLSLFFSGASLVYLRARQACDGQAVSDIWPRRPVLDAIRAGEVAPLTDQDTPDRD